MGRFVERGTTAQTHEPRIARALLVALVAPIAMIGAFGTAAAAETPAAAIAEAIDGHARPASAGGVTPTAGADPETAASACSGAGSGEGAALLRVDGAVAGGAAGAGPRAAGPLPLCPSIATGLACMVAAGFGLLAGRARRRGDALADECARLRHAAHHDPLTGLANRRHLADVRAHLDATGGGFALLLMDLDGFKAVNDSAGHAAGDAVLQQVAAAIRARLPEGALAARTGGDEFALIVPDASDAALEAFAAGLLVAVGAVAGSVEGPRIGASVGIARLAEDTGRWFAEADAALYKAKALGRNRVELHRGPVPLSEPGLGAEALPGLRGAKPRSATRSTVS